MSHYSNYVNDIAVINGRVIPIVTRKKSTDPIWCPYCDGNHTHGTADGHRATHCSTVVAKRKLYINDQTVDESHGYIIQTIGENPLKAHYPFNS